MTFLAKCRPIIGLFLVASLVLAQDYNNDYPDYQDYAEGHEQDNLYSNYAQRQQDKQGGGGGYVIVMDRTVWRLY